MKLTTGLLGAVLLVAVQISNAQSPTPDATANDFSNALTSTSSLRTLYADHLQITGETPISVTELGYDEAVFQNDLVAHIDIDPYSGAIMLGLTPQFGQNRWAAFIPSIEDFGQIRWTCQTTVDKNLMGTTGCRGGLPFGAITRIVDADYFTQTLTSLAPVRTSYSERYQNTGTLPQSLAEIGVNPEWFASSDIEHIIVEARRRAILVGLPQAFGTNQWLALVPRPTRYGTIRWRCRTTLPSTLTGANSGCQTDQASENLIR